MNFFVHFLLDNKKKTMKISIFFYCILDKCDDLKFLFRNFALHCGTFGNTVETL